MNQIELEKVVDVIYAEACCISSVDRLVDIAAQAVHFCARFEEEDGEIPARPALHLRELRRAAERVANITDPMSIEARRLLLEDAVRIHGQQLVVSMREAWPVDKPPQEKSLATTGSAAMWGRTDIDPDDPDIIGWKIYEGIHCRRCANVRYRDVLPHRVMQGHAVAVRSGASSGSLLVCVCCLTVLTVQKEA